MEAPKGLGAWQWERAHALPALYGRHSLSCVSFVFSTQAAQIAEHGLDHALKPNPEE